MKLVRNGLSKACYDTTLENMTEAVLRTQLPHYAYVHEVMIHAFYVEVERSVWMDVVGQSLRSKHLLLVDALSRNPV